MSTLAQVVFRRRAKVVPQSNFPSAGELSTTVARRLKEAQKVCNRKDVRRWCTSFTVKYVSRVSACSQHILKA